VQSVVRLLQAVTVGLLATVYIERARTAWGSKNWLIASVKRLLADWYEWACRLRRTFSFRDDETDRISDAGLGAERCHEDQFDVS